jgi:hypothetical protein
VKATCDAKVRAFLKDCFGEDLYKNYALVAAAFVICGVICGITIIVTGGLGAPACLVCLFAALGILGFWAM